VGENPRFDTSNGFGIDSDHMGDYEQTRFVVVLEILPVDSPETAVHVNIVADGTKGKR